ncbi:hypothetical protein CRYUN_Cryun32bG0023200 [Craigia yunnanensis]
MNSFGGTHPPATAGRKIRQERRCEGPPSTPLLNWTFYNNDKEKPHRSSSCAEAAGDGVKFSGGRHEELSARKLAAGLCQLQLSAGLLRGGNGGFGSKRRSSNRLRFGPGMGHVNMTVSQNHSSKEHSSDINHLRGSRSTILGTKRRTFHKVRFLISLEVVVKHLVMTDESIW